jgi:hypothetical protein
MRRVKAHSDRRNGRFQPRREQTHFGQSTLVVHRVSSVHWTVDVPSVICSILSYFHILSK